MDCEFYSSSSGAESSDFSSFVSSDSSEDELSSDSEGYITDSSKSVHGYPPPPTVLHWVRMSCLRIHDNPALNYAILEPEARFKAVFIIDPWFAAGEKKFGVNRWRFLLESLHDLDKRLRRMGSRLSVVRGQPLAVLERLCREWNVTHLTFQIDREPHSFVLEKAVQKLAENLSVSLHKFSAHTLYDTNKVLETIGRRKITSFREFGQLLATIGPPDLPVETPNLTIAKLYLCVDDVHENRIPTMEELGFPGESLYTNVWIGGETETLRRLPLYCQMRSHPKTNQVDLLFDKTSLSPYVRFGCLSVRYFLATAKAFARSDPKFGVVVKELLNKLLQREFYFTIAAKVPNFDTYKNPLCLPLPWETDQFMLNKWREGRTGYPWIDAAMRQLSRDGWIHVCLRESVATFLTRGDLWISWEKGKDVFEELLLDFEPSVSCGCWMKSSCSAFITGPVEHYCPITYGQKIDPHGEYIRAYIPELKRFPSPYIYCPWTAPVNIQVQAGCQIGVDYPNPMVDHATAGAICCQRLRDVMERIHQASCQALTAGYSAVVQSGQTKRPTDVV